MIITPKIKGFICTTSHPVGCAENVISQAKYIASKPHIEGPKNVLVLGASTGYGLASRIMATFGCNADTVGVSFERPSTEKRTATPGWYNTIAFEKLSEKHGNKAYSLNVDAFSNEGKTETIDKIRLLDGGKIDLIIYSLASPKRTDSKTGEVYSSVIKPIGEVFDGKTVNINTGIVSDAHVEAANKKEIADTVKVMGGEDWLDWINALNSADVIAENACTIAFSYIGPEQTHAIYKDGTIGKAKEDLEQKAIEISNILNKTNGKAYVSVNKALVTQASAAIPVVPLYISILYKIMKSKGLHEGCIEQIQRMFERIYTNKNGKDWSNIPVDAKGRIRMDDWEMQDDIQAEIIKIWDLISTENLSDLADIEGYRLDFSQLFGFDVPNVDYSADVEF